MVVKTSRRVTAFALDVFAEHARKCKQALLAGREQFLAGEFRRGVQIERRAASIRRDHIRRERVPKRIVSGRSLQDRGFGLDEILEERKP